MTRQLPQSAGVIAVKNTTSDEGIEIDCLSCIAAGAPFGMLKDSYRKHAAKGRAIAPSVLIVCRWFAKRVAHRFTLCGAQIVC